MYHELEPTTLESACLALSNGDFFLGTRLGASKLALGELCFNTSMTGYQEILTDPSYTEQIIVFTVPHIGNVGVNSNDIEHSSILAQGMVCAQYSKPSNFRATHSLNQFLSDSKVPGISGINTRRLTHLLRESPVPIYAAIGLCADYTVQDLIALAQNVSGVVGKDIAKTVSCKAPYAFKDEGLWEAHRGYTPSKTRVEKTVVVVDFGVKRAILRQLVALGVDVWVVPAWSSCEDIMRYHPCGVLLSNGPGDPVATGAYAVPMIQDLLKTNIPVFGICLGHQMLGLALGQKTQPMSTGHRGANHPVKDLKTGKIEITSQNHGFCVLKNSDSEEIDITHLSLFDGSIEGLALRNKPVFSVQYHPEASPGPSDSHHLFHRFADLMGINS